MKKHLSLLLSLSLLFTVNINAKAKDDLDEQQSYVSKINSHPDGSKKSKALSIIALLGVAGLLGLSTCCVAKKIKENEIKEIISRILKEEGLEKHEEEGEGEGEGETDAEQENIIDKRKNEIISNSSLEFYNLLYNNFASANITMKADFDWSLVKEYYSDGSEHKAALEADKESYCILLVEPIRAVAVRNSSLVQFNIGKDNEHELGISYTYQRLNEKNNEVKNHVKVQIWWDKKSEQLFICKTFEKPIGIKGIVKGEKKEYKQCIKFFGSLKVGKSMSVRKIFNKT